MNIYQKIATLREEILKAKIKKSGNNKFAGFDYYELADFLPIVIEKEKQLGLISLFSIDTLTVVNTDKPEEVVFFTTKVAEANMKGALEIQKTGAENTYAKRYVYLNYLNLTENDWVDGQNQKEIKDEPKKVKQTIEEESKIVNPVNGKEVNTDEMDLIGKLTIIKELCGSDNVYKACMNHYKVTEETITEEIADTIIKRIREKKAARG